VLVAVPPQILNHLSLPPDPLRKYNTDHSVIEIVNALKEHCPSIAEKLRWCRRNLIVPLDSQSYHSPRVRPIHCHNGFLCSTCSERMHKKRLLPLIDRLSNLLHDDPLLRCYHATFTIRSRASIGHAFDHLNDALTRFTDRARRYRSGARRNWIGELIGGSLSIEITRTRAWHVHAHAILVSKTELQEVALGREWKDLTGDSDNVKLRPFDTHVNILNRSPANLRRHLLEDFRDVFEYITKFGDLSGNDRAEAYLQLTNRGAKSMPRLFRTFGVFHGVKDSDPTPRADESVAATNLHLIWDDNQWKMRYRDCMRLIKARKCDTTSLSDQ